MVVAPRVERVDFDPRYELARGRPIENDGRIRRELQVMRYVDADRGCVRSAIDNEVVGSAPVDRDSNTETRFDFAGLHLLSADRQRRIDHRCCAEASPKSLAAAVGEALPFRIS